jgi:hypothetical protein
MLYPEGIFKREHTRKKYASDGNHTALWLHGICGGILMGVEQDEVLSDIDAALDLDFDGTPSLPVSLVVSRQCREAV